MATITPLTAPGALKKRMKKPQVPPQTPLPPAPETPPLTSEQLHAAARTDFINNNHNLFLNQTGTSPAGPGQAGTNYDQWANETGYGRVYDQGYNTARMTPGADPAMNFEDFVNSRPDLGNQMRFAYAHRPDNERQPNLYAGGGGHWSWWD